MHTYIWRNINYSRWYVCPDKTCRTVTKFMMYIFESMCHGHTSLEQRSVLGPNLRSVLIPQNSNFPVSGWLVCSQVPPVSGHFWFSVFLFTSFHPPMPCGVLLALPQPIRRYFTAPFQRRSCKAISPVGPDSISLWILQKNVTHNSSKSEREYYKNVPQSEIIENSRGDPITRHTAKKYVVTATLLSLDIPAFQFLN